MDESQLGKLYLSRMSWMTTENKLKEYFSKYGLLKECIIFFSADTNHSTGFGSVVFEDPFVLSSVLQECHYIDDHLVELVPAELVLRSTESSTTALDEISIEEQESMSLLQLTREMKKLEVKDVEKSSRIDRVERNLDRFQRDHDRLQLDHERLQLQYDELKHITKYKMEPGRDFAQDPCMSTSGVGENYGENRVHRRKIFVGGLPETLTDEKLNQYFETFGHVTYGKIRTYQDTNISRKFAYVTFDTEDAVDKVLLKGAYHKLENVTVEVKRAVDKDKRQADNGGWRLAHHQNYNSSGVDANSAGIPPQPTYGYPNPPFYSSWLPYGPANYNVGYNMNEFASGNAGTQNPPEYMPNVQGRGGHWNAYGGFYR